MALGVGVPFMLQKTRESGVTYLLDDLSSTPDSLISPSKAFSASFETAAIIRLRRTSDGAESDFTGADIGSGADLTWVGAQTSFVRYVYDQSGNSKHLGQATASYQGQYTDASGNKIAMDDGNPAPQQIPTGMTYPALGFTGSDGAAVFRFNGNSDAGWKLLRNGGAHLIEISGVVASPVSGVGTPVIKVNGVTLSPYTRAEALSEMQNTDVTVRVTDIDWSANGNWPVIVPYLTYFGNAKMSSVALYNAEPSSADLDLIVTAFETT
jgi:hypothetical protein|tara:strand:+ start:272 stop:1072 length:801 start_codon:yes stop_codon:yes gene_type:complete